MLNGALWVCWQGADDGMVVLLMRPRTRAGLEPVFVCIFFHMLLANPAHVHEISVRDTGAAVDVVPWAEFLKGCKTIQE